MLFYPEQPEVTGNHPSLLLNLLVEPSPFPSRASQRPQMTPTTTPAPMTLPAAAPAWGSGNCDSDYASDLRLLFLWPLDVMDAAGGN